MAVLYKVLGQALAAASPVTLYSVGSNRMAITSTLNICNTSNVTVYYTVEISPDGSASKLDHSQFVRVQLAPAATDCLTLGWTLQAGAIVRVTAKDASNAFIAGIAFTLFGQELTPA